MARCRCAPSLIVLRNQVDVRWPGRDHASDGCCGDAAHAARVSDHNPATSGPGKGYAHAMDIDEDIVANMGDRPLWATGVLLLSDPRTKYLIYEAQLLYPDGTVKAYHGINAHRHHLHVSIKPGATFATEPWPLPAITSTPGPRPASAHDPEGPMAAGIFVYRQSNTKEIKLCEGVGKVTHITDGNVVNEWLIVLDQRPPVPDQPDLPHEKRPLAVWVLSAEFATMVER